LFDEVTECWPAPTAGASSARRRFTSWSPGAAVTIVVMNLGFV
jgi:hypothetical protein